jgi:ribosomal protein S18 acetylase RimI-like enzyme
MGRGDDPIAVRRARPDDAPALRAILHDTFESTWAPQVTPAAARAFREQDRPAAYVAERGLQFRVAERAGEVVGFVDWDGDFVNALHVRSEHARTGVGGLLMDEAEAAIASAGFPAARLETDTFNARSRAFYGARGYREADSYPDTEWDSGLTTLLLVKALGRSES